HVREIDRLGVRVGGQVDNPQAMIRNTDYDASPLRIHLPEKRSRPLGKHRTRDKSLRGRCIGLAKDAKEEGTKLFFFQPRSSSGAESRGNGLPVIVRGRDWRWKRHYP